MVINLDDFNAFIVQFAKIGAVDYDRVEKEMDIFQQELLRLLNTMQEMCELTEEFAQIVRETVRGTIRNIEVEMRYPMKRMLLRKRKFEMRFNARWYTAATGA